MRRLKQKESLVAEVNDKGEVTVEGEFVGRLEGFRFQPGCHGRRRRGADAARRPACAALTPEFHLRADRFYNAPDTEIDFTEQGGLMWGDARRRQAGRGRRGAAARRSSPSSTRKPARMSPRRSRRRLAAFHRPQDRGAVRAADRAARRRNADRPCPRLRLPAGRGAGRPAARRRGRRGQGARPGRAAAACASTACASASSPSSCRCC